MRFAAMMEVAIALAAVVEGHTATGAIAPTADRTVTVCMENESDPHASVAAQALASKIFAGIGVNVEWPRVCPQADTIRITLSSDTPGNRLPGALAYALPYEGTHIVVFYDRVEQTAPPWAPILLAHVLVHEITHILQGSSRHSETGIMKAHWNDADLFDMFGKPLRFTEHDVRLINAGIEARRSDATARR